MWNLIIVLVGVIITGFVTIIVKKYFAMTDKMNELKTIFVDCLTKIESLDWNDDIKAGDIVVDNLHNTDILIRKLSHDIIKCKTRKIEGHYNEYKKPYERPHNAKVMLKGLRSLSSKPDDKSFLYVNNKIPNAKKIAIKHLKKLIKDFNRV